MVLASEGYPERAAVGRRLGGAEPSGPGDDGPLLCFHGGTRRGASGGYETTAGRAATFVGLGPDLAAAREAAYRSVAGSELDGGQHRADIGLRELD